MSDAPERKNALGMAAIEPLVRALEAAAVDDGLGAVVLRGASQDFCSGAKAAAARN